MNLFKWWQVLRFRVGKWTRLHDFKKSVKNGEPDFSRYIFACMSGVFADALSYNESIDEVMLELFAISIMAEVLMA